jgi:hypothetical protein
VGRSDEAAALLARAIDPAPVPGGSGEAGPPGFAGWWLPVEPFLQQHADNTALKSVIQRVGERAR